MRETWKRYLCAVTTLLVAVAGLAVIPSFAAVVPQDDPLREQEFRHPDLWYENVFRPAAELPARTQRQLGSELSRLGVAQEHAFFDLRTGRWGTLILAQPMIPGSGVRNDLQWSSLGYEAPPRGEALEQAVWEQFRGYLAAQAAELRIDPQELAEPTVTVIGDRLVQIHAGRTIDGIPVRDTFVKAALNSGNLILYGARNWGPVEVSLTPGLNAAQAEDVVRQHAQDFPFARLHEQPHLELIPTSSQPEEAATFLGAGLEYRLAWVLRPYFENHIGAWEALVDAHSGELLSFVDTNHYASRRVEGWVYPVSNDGEGDDGTLQPGFPMPFADIALDGTDVGFATTGGNAPTGSDPGTISTTLSGEFIRMNDSCGAIDESADAGDLDLEGVDGTDCAVPPDHSAGDTNSSRSGFYELNRLAEQARGYLPDNTWLGNQLTANMNLPQTCNAFWDGSTVNFFRSAPGSGCANTGEIAAVFDHEWGHGMDDNDGNPNVSNPGEGIADIFAYNRLNDSCVGRGFFTDGSVCGGYGDPCVPEGCTGIRDIDYEGRVSGQPHDIAWIDANCGGGPAPCGGIVHCEGAVYSEAEYDLVNRDLMGFEGSPFDLDLNTALEIGTRLSYYGSSNVGNWYQCATDGTGGCNADGGYLGFLAADDDNGDITDGTPHMSAIFAAFERHQISCNVPAVVDSGCGGGPDEAPANVVADTFDEGVQLTWDPVAGAEEYWIFRTEGVHGCDFGKALVGTTTDPTFSESGLRNGFEVFYSVSAVGASDACVSPMSACVSAIPTAGPSGFIEGTVIDADTSAPIEGAIVEAVGDVTVADETDDAGFYRILVPVGTYDVTANAEDYDPQTTTGVEVLEDETVTLDFALSLTPRPIADISPDSFEFVLNDGEVGTDTLSIGNLGDLDLEWSITTDAPETATTPAPNALDHDPALDEPLDVPDFVIDSPANGGSPAEFTIPAGVLTRGDVVGFSFIGSVTGISGTGSWASDMCMIIEAPDGTTYAVGGFTGTQAGCNVNDWDFQGSGSSEDGTYESFHDNVFPVVGDEGDWTLTFINDWDNTGAGTMDWTDVTVTLHKQPLPVCDDATDVPWLSAAPDAGTTAPGDADEVTVTADSTAAGLGEHEAALCVATNDPDAPVVPVLVSLTVLGDGDEPVIDVDPDSLSSTLEEGQTETQPLTIFNLGVLDLDWQVTETGAITRVGEEGSALAAMPRSARRAMAASGSSAALRRGAVDSVALDAATLLGKPLPSLEVVSPVNGLVDCEAEPGIIVHDDGTVENGYTGDFTQVDEVRFVDRFTPDAYPAAFTSVCLAFLDLNTEPATFDFEIVVFDDDGPDGAPGTELGSLAVSADGIPNTPGAPTWFDYDISSLGISIEDGSVYIGARWSAVAAELVLIAADESTGNPPGFAGGYWWNDGNAMWIPTEDPDLGFENYRSLMVRAVAGTDGGDCALPAWVGVSPTSGTVPGGGSQVADVTFDATGLDPDTYTANLCLASNDPVNPLVMVPLTLTVEDGDGEPIADISPDSFTFEVPTGGSDSDTLNVGNIGTADLMWDIEESEDAPTLLEEWSDDFDDYATGSQIHGQGGWKGWFNDPAAGALVSDAQAQSTPNSVEIVGASDLVHEYVDSTSGQWTYTAWQFIPADFTGATYFIMLNSYDDSGTGLNWSTQVQFVGDTDTVINDGASGGTLPLIRDQWVEIRVEIDLDADTQDFFYNNELLYSGTWTDENSGGGALIIDAVDLFANGASAVYYDDLSLTSGGQQGGCAEPTDVPWLSATPASGTTAPDASEPVDVAVDAATLDPGDYTARLCVNTNDPNAPLVEVPVSLTVTEGGPADIDVTPTSLSFEVPTGGTDEQTLDVANVGGEDLTWSLDEAEPGLTAIVVPEGAPYRYGLADMPAFNAPVGSSRATAGLKRPASVPADPVVMPAPQAQAVGSFTEGFDDITTLPGAGWAMINNSEPVGPSSWFQGNETIFPSHEGAPDAYIAANYESAADGGDVSNWLLTPEVTIVNGTTACFWTRTTEQFEEFYDRLEVRMSIAGASTDVGDTAESVGDFTDLLLSINPDLMPNEYPEDWTEFCVTVRERSRQPVTGRFAFRYWVTDTSVNGDYIGIDTVSVTQPDDIPDGGCDNPVDIPWLAADPTSGTTAPGASDPVTVSVDATGLDVGDYAAQLCVNSDDPDEPLVEVPVTLTVTEGGGGDEPLDIGDFEVVSPANGGEPVVITVPGGVLNPGNVHGFHFIGTASGISGNGSWASDTCMIVEAPDGTTFGVGGISGTDPLCDVNDWDFQGSDSTEDGTYESTHENVFPDVGDAGDWTFTFINDWDNTSAATITWTDVTVTLDKTTLTVRARAVQE